MNNKGQEFKWQEIKDIWINSAQTKQISIQMSTLLDELKANTNQFEKDSIKSDIATLKANWTQVKGKVSQFEKDAINKDLIYISRLLKQFFNLFKRDK